MGFEGDGVEIALPMTLRKASGSRLVYFLTDRTNPMRGVFCSDQQQIEYSRDLFLPGAERVERDGSAASFIIYLASLFVQCST